MFARSLDFPFWPLRDEPTGSKDTRWPSTVIPPASTGTLRLGIVHDCCYEGDELHGLFWVELLEACPRTNLHTLVRQFEYFSPCQRVFDRPGFSTGRRVVSPNKGTCNVDLKCGRITLSKGVVKKDDSCECQKNYVLHGSQSSDSENRRYPTHGGIVTAPNSDVTC